MMGGDGLPGFDRRGDDVSDGHEEADQAQAMIRRVSPQGRAEARRLRAARARRTQRLTLACAAIATAVYGSYVVLHQFGLPVTATGLVLATMVIVAACALLLMARRERTPAAPTVAPGELPLLPSRAEAWVASQRPALPAPAAVLLDGIGARIAALGPHLSGLDEVGAPADELRRLVGAELPGLVARYRAIPAGLRGEARADGETPDARLAHGLGVVDRQLADLTRRIGAGAADGLSTHDRYLESKYGDDASGGLP